MRSYTRIIAFILLFGTFLCTGCGGSNEVSLAAGDNGGQVELEAGQTLVITLDSNPSTGYSWTVVEPLPSGLNQVGEAEYRASNPNPAPGSGGVEIFRFEAKSAGEGTLTLVYHRPWEEDVDPIGTFMVQVTVR